MHKGCRCIAFLVPPFSNWKQVDAVKGIERNIGFSALSFALPVESLSLDCGTLACGARQISVMA